MNGTRDLEGIMRHFQVDGQFLSAEPHGSGHINHSFRVTVRASGLSTNYLLQRLNTNVFKDPAALMENVQRVTSHLAAKLQGHSDAARRVLTLVVTREGRTWHEQPDGSCWRLFRFIDNARTFDSVMSEHQAFEAVKAFGTFQRLLADLPAPRLHETIPFFHDTPRRLLVLEQALKADAGNRAAQAAPEIAFVLTREAICSVLVDAGLPERVTHNDTKLNNVLFDDASGGALCVIDLDTVMPGLALYDFGDMVRTATSPTAEDEPDLSRVGMQMPLFAALVKGYSCSAGDFLTQQERRYLPLAGKLIAFEQAIRFLTDYLSGDVYYKITHPGQNLDRCRTQLRMVLSMEQQEAAMHDVVRAAFTAYE